MYIYLNVSNAVSVLENTAGMVYIYRRGWILERIRIGYFAGFVRAQAINAVKRRTII